MSNPYDYETMRQQCEELAEENKLLRADLADRVEHARLILWAEVLLFIVGVIVGAALRGYAL